MLTLILLIALAAFLLTIASAIGKCPLWIPVLMLSIFALVQCIPVR
jgi:hypothetical protein